MKNNQKKLHTQYNTMTKPHKNKAGSSQAKNSKPSNINRKNKGGKAQRLVLLDNLQSQLLNVVKNLKYIQPIAKSWKVPIADK